MEIEVHPGTKVDPHQYQRLSQAGEGLRRGRPTEREDRRGVGELRLQSTSAQELDERYKARKAGLQTEFLFRDRQQLRRDRSRSETAPPASAYDSYEDESSEEDEEEYVPAKQDKGKGKAGEGPAKGNPRRK